jgi:hypothetical protein
MNYIICNVLYKCFVIIDVTFVILDILLSGFLYFLALIKYKKLIRNRFNSKV